MNNDDSRITAYALGELSGAEREAFEKELAASPETDQAVREIRATADFLREGFSVEAEREGLTGAQKAAVLSGRATVSSGDGGDGVIVEVNFWRRARRHVFWAGGAAAAVLCALFVVKQDESMEVDSARAPSYETFGRAATEESEASMDDRRAGFGDVAAVPRDASEVEMTVTVRSDDNLVASLGDKQENEMRELQEVPALRRAVDIRKLAEAPEAAPAIGAGAARLPAVATAPEAKMKADKSRSETGSVVAMAGGDDRRASKLRMKAEPMAAAPSPASAAPQATVVSKAGVVADEARIAASKPAGRQSEFDIVKGAAETGDSSDGRRFALVKELAEAAGVEIGDRTEAIAASVSQPKNRTRINGKSGAVIDASKKVILFENEVSVGHAAFDLNCNTLKVFLYNDGKVGRSVSSGDASDLDVIPVGDRRSDIMKAIAKGAVVITRKGNEGESQVGRCREATYEDSTGALVLRGLPQVRHGSNLVIATDEKTVIILKADGGMEVDGPHRTKLVEGEGAGERPE